MGIGGSGAGPVAVTIVLGGGADPTFAELSDGRSASIYGQVDWEALGAAADRVLDLVQPQVAVELPDAHLQADRDEREAAVALFDGLSGAASMRPIRDRLVAMRAEASAAGQPFNLVLDARSDDLRNLPWEVLSALPPAHPLAGVRVLRLMPTPRPRPLRTGRLLLEVLLWEPAPDDPITAGLASRLAQLADELPRARLVRLPADLGDLPELNGGRVPRVLHVLCHGHEAAERIVLEASAAGASAGAMARGLGTLLDEVDLVVFGVCEAASDRVRPLEAPAPRLAAAGLPAVVGPRLAVDPEAAAAFDAGLYSEICRGADLVQAVEEGRRRVARLDLAHPSGRFYNPALYLSDLRVATGSGCLAPPRIAGWAPGASAVEEVVSLAIGRARSTGFLGVEHLALALAESAHLGRPARAFRLHKDQFEAALEHLRIREPSPEPPPTKRLLGLAASFEPGFGVEDFALALLDTPSLRLLVGEAEARRLRGFLSLSDDTEDRREVVGPADTEMELDRDPDSVADPITQSAPPGPPAERPLDCPTGALVLEVLGGPDDGTLVVLSVRGEVIGRWDQGEMVPGPGRLFRPPLPESTRVSRRHCRYLGGALLELGASVRVLRADSGASIDHRLSRHAADSLPQELELRVGDLLLLDVLLKGAGLWLRVRAIP